MSAIEKNQCLERLPFWDSLSQEERLVLQAGSSLSECKKGQVLHSAGEKCLGAVFVIRGELRSYMLSEEGREITLLRLYRGDSCVLTASCAVSRMSLDAMLTAEADSQVLVISPSCLSALAKKNIYVRCYMYESLTQSLSSAMWAVQQILFKGYDRRLAGFLMSEYERTGSPQINMTHQQIATLTSSAREVVARMLKRFSADGLVEVKRGCIFIKDIAALKRLM